MKMHDKDEESIIPEEKSGSLNQKRSEECEGFKFKVFGSERGENLSREIEGSEIRNRDSPLYRNLIKLDRSRVIKELSSFKNAPFSCQTS